jgi:hypothetical protein
MKKLLLCLLASFTPIFPSQIDPLYEFDNAQAYNRGICFSCGYIESFDEGYYQRLGIYVSREESSSRNIMIPLKLGYSFDRFISAGVIVPFYIPYQVVDIYPDKIEVYRNSALSNPWIWSKWLITSQDNYAFGPRLAIKLPYAAYTIEDDMDGKYYPSTAQKALTGDKSVAVDASVLYAYSPQSSGFRMDGQLGLRYSTTSIYDYSIQYYDNLHHNVEEISPGMTLALRIEPGLCWGTQKLMTSFLDAYYTMQLSDFRHKITVNDELYMDLKASGTKQLTLGVGQKWKINDNGTIIFRFLIDLMRVTPDYDAFDLDPFPMGHAIEFGYDGVVPF